MFFFFFLLSCHATVEGRGQWKEKIGRRAHSQEEEFFFDESTRGGSFFCRGLQVEGLSVLDLGRLGVSMVGTKKRDR